VRRETGTATESRPRTSPRRRGRQSRTARTPTPTTSGPGTAPARGRRKSCGTVAAFASGGHSVRRGGVRHRLSR
jgi:hypothetical protein